MSPIPPQPECIILGGGLAGAMTGCLLASAGRPTLLLEREPQPRHKVCGEFLSPEAVAYLRQVGVDPLALGAATVRRLIFSVGRRSVTAALPFVALSLSRGILDEALLARAAQAGCRVLRGLSVEQLGRHGSAWAARCASGETFTAPAAFLATGKHDLRGWGRPPGWQSDLVGFKMHWRLAPGNTRNLRENMELFLFRGGYGGLCLVERDIANLCFVVRKPVLRRHGHWAALLTSLLQENQRLRELLSAATPLWDRPLAISSIPYGYLGSPYIASAPAPDGGRRTPVPHRLRLDLKTQAEPTLSREPRVPHPRDVSRSAAHARADLPFVPPQTLWPIGDQIAVIPSFTGDGMSIALHSATLAVRSYLAGLSPSPYQAELVRQLAPGMRLASLLSRVCVSPVARLSAPALLAVFPQLMAWIAAATRIPGQALLIRPTLR